MSYIKYILKWDIEQNHAVNLWLLKGEDLIGLLPSIKRKIQKVIWFSEDLNIKWKMKFVSSPSMGIVSTKKIVKGHTTLNNVKLVVHVMSGDSGRNGNMRDGRT